MRLMLIAIPAGYSAETLQGCFEDEFDVATKVVDLPDEFEFLRTMNNPKDNSPITFGLAHLALMPIVLNAATDVLTEDRKLA